MGILWVAEHRALHRDVVIKFLKNEVVDDPKSAARIVREARAAARVRSPHVVQIFDQGLSEGTPFIVMELLEGRDLRSLLEVRGALSSEETVSIVRQLALALEKTHAAGVVHGDVKPSNVFLCDGEPELFVKLLDFGLAVALHPIDRSSAKTQHCGGTPPYMSPEQIVGERPHRRSDLWALGVVAFECLTGKRPFGGETLGAVTLAIHTLASPRPTAVNPALPPAVDDWFHRACARHPEERFGSAREAAEGLREALGADLPKGSDAGARGSFRSEDCTVTVESFPRGRARSVGRVSVSRIGTVAFILAAGAIGVTNSVRWISSHTRAAAASGPPSGIAATLVPMRPAPEPSQGEAQAAVERVDIPTAPARSMPRPTSPASRSRSAAPSSVGLPAGSASRLPMALPSELPDERR
jgi:serine/threonine-protein kinase